MTLGSDSMSDVGSADTGETDLSQRKPDSAGQYITLPRLKTGDESTDLQQHIYNPLVAGALSSLVPGAGQIYCSTGPEDMARRRGQWIRGGLYLTAQGIAVGVLVNRVAYYRYLCDALDDSAGVRGAYRRIADTAIDAAVQAAAQKNYQKATLHYEILRFSRRAGRYNMYQAAGWNAGIYLFNVMNAIGASRYFENDNPKNPVTAAWLSAVPALGLGQLYNGAVSKAGMIWMAQTMLVYMAFNYHRLMIDCMEQQDMLADTSDWRYAYRNDPADNYQKQWEDKYNESFRRRNMYLWYGVFFYFYAIFDAAVDAHLHDYRRKVLLEPALDWRRERIGLSIAADF